MMVLALFLAIFCSTYSTQILAYVSSVVTHWAASQAPTGEQAQAPIKSDVHERARAGEALTQLSR